MRLPPLLIKIEMHSTSNHHTLKQPLAQSMEDDLFFKSCYNLTFKLKGDESVKMPINTPSTEIPDVEIENPFCDHTLCCLIIQPLSKFLKMFNTL